jgi:acetylornithine/N-succinyldiaminopimelate aminotransferase
MARDLEPQGLLLNSPRPDLLRFMSALTVTKEEIDLMLALLSEVIDNVQ